MRLCLRLLFARTLGRRRPLLRNGAAGRANILPLAARRLVSSAWPRLHHDGRSTVLLCCGVPVERVSVPCVAVDAISVFSGRRLVVRLLRRGGEHVCGRAPHSRLRSVLRSAGRRSSGRVCRCRLVLQAGASTHKLCESKRGTQRLRVCKRARSRRPGLARSRTELRLEALALAVAQHGSLVHVHKPARDSAEEPVAACASRSQNEGKGR